MNADASVYFLVNYLFNLYNSTTGCTIPESIVYDIYRRTGGHKGLVCLCGKAIDEYLQPYSKNLTYENWIQFAIETLPR